MRFLLVLLFLLDGFILFSQSPENNNKSSLPDSTRQTGDVIIRNITFTGNKITKERIIRREILFKENDTIPVSEIGYYLQQSRKNLINTSLFNFVTYDSIPAEGQPGYLDVTLEFIERWYIWPVPILELADRNFNAWLKKKDWSRINYGFFLTWNNFRGRRERLVVYARFGYDEKYELSYQIPYINRKQTLGLGFSGGWAQNHEIAYNSIDNKEVYYKSEDNYPKKVYFAKAETYFRKSIHNLSLWQLAYFNQHVTDSVLFYNPDYNFGPDNVNQYFSLFYQFRSDFRDYKQYPMTGYYFDIEVEKKGFGIFEPSVNTFYIKSNYRQFVQLEGRWYWGTGVTGKMAPLKHQPYTYLQGLGYGRDFVRGYEYYVVDGEYYGLWKNNLKFELVPNRVLNFNFIPTEKFSKLYYAFYLNAYVDMGYVVDNRDIDTNPLANRYLMGYGLGLDFVSYYDFVIRFEYSFNIKGESGFFIHFMPSI
ncbi:MAG: hypothetical protein JW731_03785 [Bacteroidales bacterium]|nr:hypothetical protein [Bacteroidales bacterium]